MNKRKIKLSLLSILILFAIFIDFVPLYIEYGSMVTYVIKPLIWMAVLINTIILFNNEYIGNKKYEKDIIFYILIATIIYFMLYFFVGFIDSFALNPYNRSISGFILNIWTFVSVIISKEYLRYYLINNCDKKKVYFLGILISLMFAFSELNKLNFIENFNDINSFVKFFIGYFAPEMFISLFLTYIAYYSSYKVTLIYRIIPLVLTLILPLLPNINWMLLALVQSIVPFFSYLFINNQILKLANEKGTLNEYKFGFKFWGVSVAFLIIMVAFGTGLLPYYPVVIATGSMEPKINVGDIVIIKKKSYDDVSVDDVIEYKVSNYTVIHRVIEKREKNLITKGDNNNSIDPKPINKDQVNGIVVFRLPYIGYPTLFIYDLLGKNLENSVEVETGR